MFIYKAGVIGAGAMGSGIAQVISFSGLPVVLKDTDMDRVNKGIEMIRKVYQGRPAATCRPNDDTIEP